MGEFMKYKLLAADMDGTLLRDGSVLSERTRAAVTSAVERGALFVLSTGRPLCGVGFVVDAFDDDLPLILCNGAVVVMGKSRKPLLLRNLPFESARDVFDQGGRRGFPVIVWVGERLFVSRDCELVQKYRSITNAPMRVIDDMEEFRDEGVNKMLWIIPPEDSRLLQDEMDAHFKGRVTCHTSQSHLMEFTGEGVTKASALAEIGKMYGIDRAEMVAVGDGYNDLSMLQYAGLGVAMGNAPEEIRGLCDEVTLTNNEDGVAAVAEKYF